MNAILKVPSQSGYQALHTQTDSDNVSYSDTNVTQVLDKVISTDNVSAFMQSLLTSASAKNIRKILRIYPEKIYDECGLHWAAGGNPQLSAYNAKFDKALQLDGSSAIAHTTSSGVALGDAPFAVECFFVPTAFSSVQCLLCLWDGTHYVALHLLDGVPRFGEKLSESWNFDLAQNALTLNQMYHGLLAYHNNALDFYLNGQKLLTLSATVTRRTFRLFIGNAAAYSTFFTGAISEVRISDGTSRYNENFTPPTEKYSVDNYTVGLLHFD